MFEFLKRKKSPATTVNVPPLFFKDGAAAFEYACEYLECPLRKGRLLPALVLDARELLGAPAALKVHDNGLQTAFLHVASTDGGFVVPASTAGARGPALQVGQLIAWRAGRYVPEVAEAATAKDKRFGWVGLIEGTLKPEYCNGSWAGDKRFSR
jgi:hypothetical protein